MRRKIRVGKLKASVLYHAYVSHFWNELYKAGILSADRVFKPITRHFLCNLRAFAELVQIGACEPTEDLMNVLNELEYIIEK